MVQPPQPLIQGSPHLLLRKIKGVWQGEEEHSLNKVWLLLWRKREESLFCSAFVHFSIAGGDSLRLVSPRGSRILLSTVTLWIIYLCYFAAC